MVQGYHTPVHIHHYPLYIHQHLSKLINEGNRYIAGTLIFVSMMKTLLLFSNCKLKKQHNLVYRNMH